MVKVAFYRKRDFRQRGGLIFHTETNKKFSV